MELKDLIVLDDKHYQPYDGYINRYTISFTKAEAAELDRVAKAFNIDSRCIIRDAVNLMLLAIDLEPKRFLEEVERCKKSQLESIMLEYHDAMRRAKSLKKAMQGANAEDLPDFDDEKRRAKLAELEERERDRLYQPSSAIWSAIRDRIQSGKNRKDKMLLWLANRQPEYREVFDAMIARGELIAERDGKKYFLRFTTPEEREKAMVAVSSASVRGCLR